ncbi:MAG: hypothetical protein COT74_03405 [Bdellovibrionales bacterium CG10_big_fil_rev_8_21_14_0_10_45_34]|nr:MAG: hypothetical protein COT74_03405 [Bdellovibrionales bacterium CG10_big_fil_rev_8_21_14_0_10_45_34]
MRKSVLVKALALLGLAACNGGGGTVVVSGGAGGGGPIYYEALWYDVYGSPCTQLQAECTYVDNYSDLKAMWELDPFYSPFEEPIFDTVYDTDYGYYVDAWGFYGVNGVFYDYYTGRAINEGNQSGRDILADEGVRESDVIEKAGEAFAAKYALDAETGVKVARTMNDWNKLAKSRSRTAEDVADFTKRLYGVDVNAFMDAIQTGEQASLDNMLQAAAESWNTSSENMRRILGSVYAQAQKQ